MLKWKPLLLCDAVLWGVTFYLDILMIKSYTMTCCRQDTEEVKEEITAVDFQRNTSNNPFAQIHGDGGEAS